MPIISHKSLNILEIQDCLYDDTLQQLREELEENVSRNGQYTQHDYQERRGKIIVDRIKVYNTRNAVSVAQKLLTEKAIWNSVEDFRDYAWKAYYATLSQRFEVALSHYPDGHFYRWHCDHYEHPCP